MMDFWTELVRPFVLSVVGFMIAMFIYDKWLRR